jgi:hypothetical protein
MAVFLLLPSAMSVGIARAQAPIGVPDNSFPESVTSLKDGTLYAGSFNLGGVVKVFEIASLERGGVCGGKGDPLQADAT